MPSLGLLNTSGRASKGRLPAFSSRVKQSCRDSNSVLRASRRSSAVKRVHSQMPNRANVRLRLDSRPHQPRQRDAQDAVGQQEVQVLVGAEARQPTALR